MKQFTHDDFRFRLGYFRDRKNLSGRKVSNMLGYSEHFIRRIENGNTPLKSTTFLELLDIYGISVFDFFYLGKEYNEESKNVLDLYANLKPEDQKSVLDLMKRLQR